MVLGAIAAAAGTGALGGVLGGIGASQAGSADRAALRAQRDAIARRNRNTQQLTDALVTGLRGASPERNDILQGRIANFGGAGATPQSTAQAQQALAAAPGALQELFSRPSNAGFTQQAPAGFAAQTADRIGARYAPQQAAQQSALARALGGVEQQRTESDLNARGLNLQRGISDLQLQRALQQALVDRRFGVDSVAADRARVDAAGTGQFMGALGGLVSGLAPAVGYGLASWRKQKEDDNDG